MRSRGWIAAAVLAVQGCSYVMMDRPPRAVRRGDTFPQCSTEHTWPYVDIAAAVTSVIGAGLLYAGKVEKNDPSDPSMMTRRALTDTERVFGGTAALIEGGLFALSARHGFTMANRCRELQPPMPMPMPMPTPTPGGAP